MTTPQDWPRGGVGIDKFGCADSGAAKSTAKSDSNADVVRHPSELKSRSQGFLNLRRKSLKLPEPTPIATWGSDTEGVHFHKIKQFVRSMAKGLPTRHDLLPAPTVRAQRRSDVRGNLGHRHLNVLWHGQSERVGCVDRERLVARLHGGLLLAGVSWRTPNAPPHCGCRAGDLHRKLHRTRGNLGQLAR